jgi:hypothetical protein
LLPELIDALREEITAEIAEALELKRAIDKGTVTELPNPLTRKIA